MVVAAFPGEQGLGRERKAGEPRSTPEFLVINAMTALDFAILLRTSRLDVAQAHPCLLDRERKGSENSVPLSTCSFRIGNGSAVWSVVKNMWRKACMRVGLGKWSMTRTERSSCGKA